MVACADEDVLRLHIAVDQPRLVRRVERVGDVREDVERAVGVELARADQVAQPRAAHELHREEQADLALAGLVDRDDVRVIEPGLE